MLLYPIAIADLAMPFLYVVSGAVIMLVVLFAYAMFAERRASKRRAPDREPLFECDYHGQEFHDLGEARQHAIDAHNAPKDGEAWKATYSGGVNGDHGAR